MACTAQVESQRQKLASSAERKCTLDMTVVGLYTEKGLVTGNKMQLQIPGRFGQKNSYSLSTPYIHKHTYDMKITPFLFNPKSSHEQMKLPQ